MKLTQNLERNNAIVILHRDGLHQVPSEFKPWLQEACKLLVFERDLSSEELHSMHIFDLAALIYELDLPQELAVARQE